MAEITFTLWKECRRVVGWKDCTVKIKILETYGLSLFRTCQGFMKVKMMAV